MRPILFGALAALIASAGLADPQTANVAPVTTLHAEARIVQIDVVVTDSQGKPVTNLSKQDFTITDEGKPRTIDIFSINFGINRDDAVRVQASSPPVQRLPPHVFSNRNAGPPNLPRHSTVIILDQVSNNPAIGPDPRNTFQDVAYAQLQVVALMNKVNPDEEIALYVIASKLGLVLLQDYTTNRELLLSRLKNYIPRDVHGDIQTYKEKPTSTPGPARRDPNAASPRETESLRVGEARQVRLSFQALAEHLALVPGRKSVFWLSEGFAPGRLRGMEQFGWDKTITALNEANVAVNAVDSVGNPGNNYRPPGSFKEIAESTGGQSWEYRNDLDAAMAEGIDASRATYTLAFYLAEAERDNKFHALKVQTDRPGSQLFYRQGYYAGNVDLPASSRDSAKKEDPESSLLNRVDSQGVGITARVNQVQGTPRGTLNIVLNLDPGTLSLKAQTGGWAGKVDETFVELDESGNTLAKVSDVKDFEVTAANRTHYDSQGVTWPFSMPLMPTAVKVAIIVRDSASGHVGSLSVPLHDEMR